MSLVCEIMCISIDAGKQDVSVGVQTLIGRAIRLVQKIKKEEEEEQSTQKREAVFRKERVSITRLLFV